MARYHASFRIRAISGRKADNDAHGLSFVEGVLRFAQAGLPYDKQ
jgi:hypothetical protein